MTYEKFVSNTIEFVSSKTKVPPHRLDADTQLIGSGIVDSLMLTELILYVEDALDCTIEVDNFRLTTFESISSIYSTYGQ